MPDLDTALAELGIQAATHEHAAVFTVEESAALHGNLPGLHTKNLFLKDAGGRFWLITAPAEARIDLKALAPLIGARELSFGQAGAMVEHLGVTPGSVTPLAAINDTARNVTVVLDSAVAGAPQVNLHPLRNTATIALAGPDLVKALAAWRHPPLVVALPGPVA